MDQKALDQFGEILMREVRDEAIAVWDKILEKRLKGLQAEIAYQKLAQLRDEDTEVLRWLLPRIVDTTLYYMLWMLEDEPSLNLSVETDSDVVNSIRDISDGLSGELYTEDGWIMRFSKQRYEEIDPTST